MTVKYDPSIGIVRTVLRVRDTVILHVLKRPGFWIFYFIFLAVYVAYWCGSLEDSHVEYGYIFLDHADIKVISAMTTFFEVFYTNQAYNRYMYLYSKTKETLQTLFDYGVFMRLVFGQDKVSLPHKRLSVRYHAASVLLFFYTLDGDVTEAQWRELEDLKLLTGTEVTHLKEFNHRVVCDVLLFWSGDVGATGIRAAGLPGNQLKALYEKILEMRTCQQDVAQTTALPIPFQYFHLLNLMVIMNLLLWAYGIGVTQSIFAPFVYFFVELIFIGMLELGQQLSDPFGKDDVDLPVNQWLSELLEWLTDFMESIYQPAETGWTDALKLERAQPAGPREVKTFLDEEEAQALRGTVVNGNLTGTAAYRSMALAEDHSFQQAALPA
eukprot:TRINITY_DN18173_c0_g1_i1.p1 TRINITY_DN18173_c0_g1~~TRINITY_DN18173_c0_g1_i1.p1  ORF type:complete len:382 (-),score=86.00 TRINITY_DN18173_c0_g1_i1:132-1277(-)